MTTPNPIADRLIAAITRDYALFVEVAQRMALIPRCGQWEPHLGAKNSFTRSDSQGSVVAMVQPKADGGAAYFLRADLGPGKDTLSISQAMTLVDNILLNKGWVFPPNVG